VSVLILESLVHPMSGAPVSYADHEPKGSEFRLRMFDDRLLPLAQTSRFSEEPDLKQASPPTREGV
jgi:hypothetical protein